MKTHTVRWCTLNKLDIRFQYGYEHATVRWYMLSYDKVVPKLCSALYG